MKLAGFRLPAALLVVMLPPALGAPSDPAPAYLFSHFLGNGESGLHLASSADGLTWTPVAGGRSFLAPRVGGSLMRDPCLLLGPDNRFHMVWTTGWWDRGIGVAHSDDLLRWSEQSFVPVMAHEPAARNAWAPEILWDARAGQYLIYWSSTIPGRFRETEPPEGAQSDNRLNHRIYATTTRDFATYTPTRLLYDGGFNVIDGTIIDLGTRVAMIVKDETRWPSPRKHLRMAFADRPDGPWSEAGPAFTADWVEGPTALAVGDTWFVYFDEYTRKRYGAMSTRDFKTFTDISDRIRFPPGTRHGTALAVPPRVITALSETN
jgi:hypothetical protein